MVREALGEDAIIVATREENGGRTVRVTAAIEADRETPEAPTNADEWLYADDDDEMTVVEEITETMLRHAVPENVLDQVVSCAAVMGLDEPHEAMTGVLESLFSFMPLPSGAYPLPIMLIGPPGAGKTLAAAKMAARGALNGLNVAVITTDTVRAGGVEQLAAFTRLMNIDLKKAASPTELKEKLLSCRGADQIIIDTAGVNPFDPEAIKGLARMIGTVEMDPVLALPAGTDADESGDIARVFAMIGARQLLSTRIDTARRLGGLLSAAQQGGLGFADISDTAKVADGLTPLTATRLTRILMPRAENARVQSSAVPATQNARKAG